MDAQEFDYVIIGGGLSGLQLAKALINDNAFNSKRIAIIEPTSKTDNDKTWSFWEEGLGQWDSIVHQSWKKAKVFGKSSEIDFNLTPYYYKSIRSIDFYRQMFQLVEASENCCLIKDEVVSVEGKIPVLISGKKGGYKALHVFDSRMPSDFKKDQTTTKLLQHFKGWVIETKQPLFNHESFTMMDYRLVYKDTTSFTYILPVSETKALVEYTFFSPELASDSVYEQQLKTYISDVLNISEYTISETEQGVIPMTGYNFQKHNSTHLTKIGTAGGWVKGSSGYSFKRTEKKVAQIISNLKINKPVTNGLFSKKHQFYDSVFLKVLEDYNSYGPELFERFYKGNSITDCFMFLDEESTLVQDFKIIWSLRSMKFVTAFFKVLFQQK